MRILTIRADLRRCWKAAVKRWAREEKRLKLLRFRQRWADKFGEYECVGGPDDGMTRACPSRCLVSVRDGYYKLEREDCRLHFKMRSRVKA